METDPTPLPEPAETTSHKTEDWAAPSRPDSPPPSRSFPLIGTASLLVTLVAVALALMLQSDHLFHARSPYYVSTLEARPPPRKMRIGSFNIRYSPRGPLQPLRVLFDKAVQKPDDGRQRWGEASWEERRERLVDQVLFHELDIVGFQEVLEHQYQDLQVLMGDEFEHVGVGRNDGKKAGEAVPIFFRKSRFSLGSVRHYWLSPTPDQPGSRGWDAGQPRMITIARLYDLDKTAHGIGAQDEEIIVANTHWDDRGLEARTQSARLILELLDRETQNVTREENGQEPLVVLLGDLNSPAEEAGYQILTGARYRDKAPSAPEKRIHDRVIPLLNDLYTLSTPDTSAYGPLNTFTGFAPSDEAKIIDFILLRDNTAFAHPGGGGFASTSGSNAGASDVLDTAFLDADDPDEVLASIPEPSAPSTSTLSRKASAGQTRWKVSRYGVIPNFSEDVGGKRGSPQDSLIVSDHRLVVVALEQVVA